MHTIRGERFGWIMPDGTIRGSQSWAEVLGELLDEAYAKAREAGVITGSEAEAAAGSLQSHLDVFDECRSPVLVHNDIWDPNILVGESEGAWRVKAIIDADRALFADREFEFALWDGPDPDFLSGYGRPIDSSPNAVLRRQFYRMQLYIQYAWFYLVMKPSPEFQASAKRTALDALEGILGMPLAG
jgi:fructosamine-3-kinase